MQKSTLINTTQQQKEKENEEKKNKNKNSFPLQVLHRENVRLAWYVSRDYQSKQWTQCVAIDGNRKRCKPRKTGRSTFHDFETWTSHWRAPKQPQWKQGQGRRENALQDLYQVSHKCCVALQMKSFDMNTSRVQTGFDHRLVLLTK